MPLTALRPGADCLRGEREGRRRLKQTQDRLRRPRQIFAEEWVGYRPQRDGPGISCIWLQDLIAEAPNEGYEFDDALAEAWDRLCDRHPSYESWFMRHRDLLVPSTAQTYLRVQGGVADKITRGRTGIIKLWFPVEAIRAADDRVAVFEYMILKLLRRRAELAGVEPPPPAEPSAG